MSATLTSPITDAHKQQFVDDGYMILPAAVPVPQLEILREECAAAIEHMNKRMDAKDPTVADINHKNQRYFIPRRFLDRPAMRDYVFSELMAEVCKATIGDDAYLFLEQFVVKASDGGMKFDWHQDGGYIPHKHKPYLTIWVALDDMTERNGTIYVLPYAKAGTREVIEHKKMQGTNDMVGYFGGDPGIPLIGPAGTLAAFSSATFHRSGPNLTDKWRRAHITQFTPEPLMDVTGTKLFKRADPFLKNGNIVSVIV